MKKKILAIIMSIVMLATFAVPAYALDLGGLLGGSSSDESAESTDESTDESADEDSGFDINEFLASDAMQEIMGSEGVIDITNVVLEIVASVGSIDLQAMGKEKALAFVQNIINQVGDAIVDTKTNVEVFADNPVDILDNLFGLNAGELVNPDGDDDDDEEDPDELVFDMGDVDGDGRVTAADARLILRRAALLIKFTDEQDWLADVDDDGEVTASDARLVLRVSAGLETLEY